MGKKKAAKAKPSKGAAAPSAAAAPAHPTTTSALREDPVLGYRMRVLLHDMCNLTKDPASERRLNSTTDEHYLSAPYFSQEQAAAVKAARVDVAVSEHLGPNDTAEGDNEGEGEGDGNGNGEDDQQEEPGALSARLQGQPLDAALHALLANFLDKRRASGDARPCGPHDLAPVYSALLGIDLAELREDKFLGRYRRAGLN